MSIKRLYIIYVFITIQIAIHKYKIFSNLIYKRNAFAIVLQAAVLKVSLQPEEGGRVHDPGRLLE